MHLDAKHAVALTRFTAAAFHVEREATRLVAARSRLREPGVELPKMREDARVRCGIRSGRSPDWRLIDADDLVDVRESLDGVARSDPSRCSVERRTRGAEQRIHDEAALAGSTDTGHRRDDAERNVD